MSLPTQVFTITRADLVAYAAASAMVYMPWAITPGSPTLRATASSWWIGLWSPLAWA